jgi:hypothetical protein
MIPTPYYKGNPLRYTHPRSLSPVRCEKLYLQFLGGGEGDHALALEGLVADTATTGEY